MHHSVIGNFESTKKVQDEIRIRYSKWEKEEIEGAHNEDIQSPLVLTLSGVHEQGQVALATELSHILTGGDASRVYNHDDNIHNFTDGSESWVYESIIGIGYKDGGPKEGSRLLRHMQRCNRNGESWRNKVNFVIIKNFQKWLFSEEKTFNVFNEMFQSGKYVND